MKQLQLISLLLLVAKGSSSFLNRNLRTAPSCRHWYDSRRMQSTRLETATEGNSFQQQTFQEVPVPTTRNQRHSLYLFSLPAPSEATSSHGSVLTKRLWEFKDDTLGDGRDFFVPRPKTISALNQILCEQVKSTEAIVLSNCARFDVILVTENSNAGELRKLLAFSLLQQYEYYKEQKQKRKLDLSFWFDGDNPSRLLLEKNGNIAVDDFDWKTLSHNLQCLEGPDAIALYMCRVASGLQAQGRRPDRDVVFRPFSSRDAHVMLQLKRTADIASITSSPRIKALLDTALQAGKAARDSALVPAILPLKTYGSGGSSSRYSLGDAPQDLIREAASQAETIAVRPMVDKYVQKWNAFEASEQIKSFRQSVERAVFDHLGLDLHSPEAKSVRAMMHPYVMDIREGRTVDIDWIIQQIQSFK